MTVTSQIAIFNSLGVAVASDTVTTHTHGLAPKTTSNAEKLWALGKDHLVVALHSGSVVMNWTNFRNFVTEWSRTLDGPLEHVDDYPASFLAWLNSDADVINPESEAAQVQFLLENHFFEVNRRFRAAVERAKEPKDEATALLETATQGFEWLSQLPIYPGASDQADAALLTHEGVNLTGLLEYLFKESAGFEEALPILLASAPLILSRVQPMPGDVEIGFVGYGSKDYFARSSRVDIRGRYGGLVRATVEDTFGADNSGWSGSLSTFAQAEAIHGFLRGAHFSLINEIANLVWDAVYRRIDETDGEDVQMANEVEAELREKIAEIQHERFVSPMLDTIGGMSLSSLAEFAESLVAMQATFAAAGSGPATVGGFIETMVISRAHGVQWVRRLPGAPV